MRPFSYSQFISQHFWSQYAFRNKNGRREDEAILMASKASVAWEPHELPWGRQSTLNTHQGADSVVCVVSKITERHGTRGSEMIK